MASSSALKSSDSDEDLEPILSLLSSMRGLDFTFYRRDTLRRCVRRRMEHARIKTIDAYVQFMKDWPAELEALCQDILVKVTHFFREPEAFEVLKAEVYPALFRARTPSTPIRVWVPGCSTGEEVYSIAISLLEALFERQLDIPIQIFATDASNAVIAKARAGIYGKDIAPHVTKERRARFFTPYGERFCINRSIREMCVFARQSVTLDPPFSRLDLISCRNVLLECEPSIQERILPTFHYALQPAGVLLLGAPWKGTDLFTIMNADHGIYEKDNTATGNSANSAEDRLPASRERKRLVVEITQEIQKTQDSMQKLLEEQEATNGDLQATNEELCASNEELHSINEELQTITEELRATNDDLSAMNEMLERGNDARSRLNEELMNVLSSIELPIMMVGWDLRIRCLTPSAKRMLELTRADVGCALGDLKVKLGMPDLERMVAEMLDRGSRREREVKLGDGRSYSLRILPYRTEERRIDGVVLLFVDIDAWKASKTD